MSSYLVIGSSNRVRSTHRSAKGALRAALSAEDRVRVIRGPVLAHHALVECWIEYDPVDIQMEAASEQRSSAARALRAIPSAARSEQSRVNGARGGRPARTVTVCLIGDDRAREYPVAWLGRGDVTTEDHDGECAVAVLDLGDRREAVVYRIGRRRWVSLGTDSVRCLRAARGYPPMTDDRLGTAQ